MKRLLLFLCLVCLSVAGAAYADEPVKPVMMQVNNKLLLQKFEKRPTVQLNPATVQLMKPVTQVQIKPIYSQLHLIKPVLPETVEQPTGPNPQATLDLSDIIEDPDLLADIGISCGFDPHLLFQDKTAANVFYYLPRMILLTHDNGDYGLSVQYGNKQGDDEAAVMVTAVVGAPFRQGDTKVLKAILREALGLKPADKLTLKAMPALGATADMDSLAAGLALEPERIHLTAPAHLKQDFRMTLALTQDEAEEMLAQLGREGLAGSLNVPVGDVSVPVPILIQYAQFTGRYIGGFQEWLGGTKVDGLVNETGFPVELNSINGYRLTGNKLERVSKKLKKSRPIAPGGTKKMKLPPASSLLGKNIVVGWLGTDLAYDCQPCLSQIDEQVRQGVSASPGEQVLFEAIPSVFAEFGLYKILVKVQSPFFTAESKKVTIKEIQLTEENNINRDMYLHLPKERGDDALLYRYKLNLITETGESVEDQEWRDGTSLSNYVGSKQIETMLPEEDGQEVQ